MPAPRVSSRVPCLQERTVRQTPISLPRAFRRSSEASPRSVSASGRRLGCCTSNTHEYAISLIVPLLPRARCTESVRNFRSDPIRSHAAKQTEVTGNGRLVAFTLPRARATYPNFVWYEITSGGRSASRVNPSGPRYLVLLERINYKKPKRNN